MDNQKQELIAKLREANNILVTVSANPSVDQLAACIGLTLALNKLKKHATAVFSGEVPSTLQFLKPEETLEKNTDSLRDFIISLDKAKADKLRYKVEDNVVKIFITPYKTSITESDLDFSQGDFNVDVVLCLGVTKQQDLDQAITSHGRILHDATVAAVSIGQAGELGTLNWVEPQASSLSELAAQISDELGKDLMDGQIATSFLTGIVAETERFSNDKTSPNTMKISAELMAAGANQQLVASELQTGLSLATGPSTPEKTDSDESKDGTLEIGHSPEADEPSPTDQPKDDNAATSAVNDSDLPEAAGEGQDGVAPLLEGDGQTPGPSSRLVLQPPSLGGTLTANSTPESFDPSVDPLSLLNHDAPMLSRDAAAPGDQVASDQSVALPEVQPVQEAQDQAPTEPAASTTELPAPEVPSFEALPSEPNDAPAPESGEKTLADLEQAVESLHLDTSAPAASGVPAEGNLDAARDAVMDAINTAPDPGPPLPNQAAGAQGYLDVNHMDGTPVAPVVPPVPATQPELPGATEVTPLAGSPADAPQTMPTPPVFTVPPVDPTPPTSVATDPTAAPPVPPPLPLDDMTKFIAPK